MFWNVSFVLARKLKSIKTTLVEDDDDVDEEKEKKLSQLFR